jgi:hypothetical protein
VTEIGKMLVILGLLVAVTGDIVYRGKHTTFYFPLATSILLSVVLTLVLCLVGRFRH